nr:hypothetical protein [Tanacetum cinerariifolium]
MIRKQVGDLSTYTIKYTSSALTQKVFANMRRVGKRFSGVNTPLFEGMLVAQEVEEGDADENVENVNAGDAAEGDEEESEPAELQEVVDIVTTAKIITEVVTAASITITTAEVPIPVATTAAALTLTAAPSRRTKGGKGILVEELKPLKKQDQIEQDEKYARELEADLNKNIDWDEVIDHVNKKAK